MIMAAFNGQEYVVVVGIAVENLLPPPFLHKKPRGRAIPWPLPRSPLPLGRRERETEAKQVLHIPYMILFYGKAIAQDLTPSTSTTNNYTATDAPAAVSTTTIACYAQAAQ